MDIKYKKIFDWIISIRVVVYSPIGSLQMKQHV